jgi:hypothetical protein
MAALTTEYNRIPEAFTAGAAYAADNAHPPHWPNVLAQLRVHANRFTHCANPACGVELDWEARLDRDWVIKVSGRFSRCSTALRSAA